MNEAPTDRVEGGRRLIINSNAVLRLGMEPRDPKQRQTTTHPMLWGKRCKNEGETAVRVFGCAGQAIAALRLNGVLRNFGGSAAG